MMAVATADLALMHQRLKSFHPEALVAVVPNAKENVDSWSSRRGQTKELGICADPISLQPPNSDGVFNLIKANFLNLLDNNELKLNAEQCIRRNGVGSCGPRGFYGTIDIHLDLEDKIAEFMGMEETVLYSYGFSTIASAIPAYCKKGDVIFCDEKVSFSTKEGMRAARCKIVYFEHNNVIDLEMKLQSDDEAVAASSSNSSSSKGSRFLIVEGICPLTGNICQLPQLMELRKRYHLRIFIDESLSFGVLGKHGRGVTEHFNVDRSDVDMIIGSLEGAVGSIGGFCVGASVIIEHQRLSGLGYCFSASLPPFLSSIAICAIDMFKEQPSIFKRLEEVSTKVHALLEALIKEEQQEEEVRVVSHPISPVKVLWLLDSQRLQTFHRACEQHKLYLNLHVLHEQPDAADHQSVSFCVNVDMDDASIKCILSIIKLSLSS